MKANVLISRFLEVLVDTRIPGLIMSSPGIGKTTTVEAYAQLKGYNLTTIIPSQYSSDDLLGLQSVVDGKLDRLAPYWYTDMIDRASNGALNLLFIDEISTCDEYLQAPLLNLIFNKSLGKHKLPDNTLIISAGNYSEDLNDSFNLTAPLVNRFLTLNIKDKDLDYSELITDEFRRAKDEGRLEKYLGFEKFKNEYYPKSEVLTHIRKLIVKAISNKIGITNSKETGLLGFASNRSVSHSFNFLDNYLDKYNDKSLELGLRVIGDSLGYAKDGDEFKNYLSKSMNMFLITKKESKSVLELSSMEYWSTLPITERDSVIAELSNRLDEFGEDTIDNIVKLRDHNLITAGQSKLIQDGITKMYS